MSKRAAWFCQVAMCLLASCQTAPAPTSGSASQAHLQANAAGAGATQSTVDSPELKAALDRLLAYDRQAFAPLECPGLLVAGSCGDGSCDAPLETTDTCPADCVFHLAGAYNDLPICPSFMMVKQPRGVNETQLAVREAVAQGKRIRVLGASHSASQLICGDGIALRMTSFGDVNKTEVRGNVAYVQPGVRMIELGDWLYQRQLSVGYTHIGFRGITVAGAVGTSAHGSSPIHASSLSERLVSVTMVLADGSLRTFEKGTTPDHLWGALASNLGLLGVITELGLEVEPAFNLDMQIDVIEQGTLLDAESPLALLKDCDFGEMNWFPGQQKALRWCGKATSAPAQQADNTLLDPGVSPSLAPLAKLGFHSGTCNDDLNALLEQVRFTGLRDQPPLLVTAADGTQTRTDHAIGAAHRMMSADLIELDDNKYFQMDWEVAVPQPYMKAALQVARQVFDAHAVHLPGVGAFLRFAKIAPGGFLTYHGAGGPFVAGQTAMFFETPTAVPAGYSEAQLRQYLYVYEQLAALFIQFYGARAHWGKNLDSLFDLQRSIGTYAGRIDSMNQAVAELDPYGVFSNAFAERIGITWPKRGENFAAALGQSTCDCDVTAQPVCAYATQQTFANPCRATCAGVTSAQLISGPCAAFEWATCSLFDPRTCVWRKHGARADRTQPPELSY